MNTELKFEVGDVWLMIGYHRCIDQGCTFEISAVDRFGIASYDEGHTVHPSHIKEGSVKLIKRNGKAVEEIEQ